jgi:glucoamylase
MPKTTIHYVNAITSRSELGAIADHMFSLMLRNVATTGWIFEGTNGCVSQPGCIIASPSHPPTDSSYPDVTDQDYVFHWTRDAAITAVELAASDLAPDSAMDDFLTFSERTQQSGANPGHACFRVDGSPRPWSEQSDGPALRTCALLGVFDQYSQSMKAKAKSVINTDLGYLLQAYKGKTTNLWEEIHGYSFFARAVQLRCFKECLAKATVLGLTGSTQTSLQQAVGELQGMLEQHWDRNAGRYRSILEPSGSAGADLDADVVMAAISGAIPCTDPKLLATASQLRRTFAGLYAINNDDAQKSLGPVIGRYPEDTYDGDIAEQPNEGHPWAPCTCNFAELYYRVAAEFSRAQRVSIDTLSKPFFDDVGVGSSTPIAEAVTKLRDAGDRMLRDVVYHSDHLELSEQFDRYNGFEKSVRNLTWSYAAFLSAVCAREA